MKPSISYFRVFGCVCYVFVPGHLRSKMDRKVVRCIFIGYDSQRKGWRCCDPTTEKCHISQNLVFDEASSWWSLNKEILPDSDVFKDVVQSSQIQLSLDETKNVDNGGNVEGGVAESPWQTGVYQQQLSNEDEPDGPEARTPLRRLTRIRKPNPKYVNVAIVEEADAKEPETFEEAFQHPKWIKAMEEEMVALDRNQTWELMPKLKDVKPISYKWVYKIKCRTNGSIERHKASLVARGFSQQYGLDYHETFSLVAKLTTVRVLLVALAASKNWNLW